MNETYKSIRDHQKSWADQQQISFDKNGYVLDLNSNLYQSLSEQADKDFKSGAGGEFGTKNKPGKMQALHSSSALVCNVFEYWRERSVNDIAVACGAGQGMSELHFEQKNPTTLSGTPPHLDVQFSGGDNLPLAIESKFTEPYQHAKTSSFVESYFAKDGLWDLLPKCKELARKICKQEMAFSRLDAAQLLKHILGLTKKYSFEFSLLYLWYEIPSPIADEHKKEIGRFTDLIDSEVKFSHMTYQELFKKIKDIPDTDTEYIRYLENRYFPNQA